MTTRTTVISLIALLLLIIKLRKDFRKDRDLHERAKIYQTLILSVLVFFNATSIYHLLWVVVNLKTVVSGYTMSVGMLTGSLQFALFVLKLLCTVGVFILCFLMSGRNEKARKVFFYALPLLCLSGLFHFYTNSLVFGNAFGLAFPNMLMIALFVYIGLTILTLLIYRSPFMKAFFHANAESPNDKEDEILDDMDLSEES
ncbi:hypothetical protein CNR22_23705 [Sphingobacteriaceae bacterium]|nr:hypothetical protein CNR22_23705 [Sphingobacteriaceae bacterium]